MAKIYLTFTHIIKHQIEANRFFLIYQSLNRSVVRKNNKIPCKRVEPLYHNVKHQFKELFKNTPEVLIKARFNLLKKGKLQLAENVLNSAPLAAHQNLYSGLNVFRQLRYGSIHFSRDF